MKKFISATVLIFLIVSCNERNNDTLLAEVSGKKLYMSDIADFVYSDDIIADSTNAVLAYTTAWVHRQLMIQKAQELLSKEQQDLTAEIEDYRSSLLVYRLEQNHINKNVDTNVTQDEIKKIYEENTNLFNVQSTLVKIVFIKIKTAMPEIENIKNKCIALNSSNSKELEDLCMLYAENYDNFNNSWIDIPQLLRLLPPATNGSELEKNLQTSKFYEVANAEYSYFIKLQDILPTGSVSPLEKEQENIRNIILNKRKRDLIQKFEQETYNASISNNDAKIYINNNE